MRVPRLVGLLAGFAVAAIAVGTSGGVYSRWIPERSAAGGATTPYEFSKGGGTYVGTFKSDKNRWTLTVVESGKSGAFRWVCPPYDSGGATVSITSGGALAGVDYLWVAKKGEPHVGPRATVSGAFKSRTEVSVTVNDMHGCGVFKGTTTLTKGTGTAATAPPIVVRDLTFVGFDKDVVGRGWDAKPNGERDAHFSVVLASPTGARSWGGDLQLLRCLTSPKLSCGGFASTERSADPRVAILAVFRNGARLNTNPGGNGGWLQLPQSAAGVRLDLYANDGPGCVKAQPGWAETAVTCSSNDPSKNQDHRFGAGQVFRVTIEAGAETYSSGMITLPGPATPEAVLSNFRFHGLGKDVLGVKTEPGWSRGTPPDGQPDGHFSIDLTTPTGPGYLTSVTMRSSSHKGPAMDFTWSGWSGTLAVFVGDTRLKLEVTPPPNKQPNQLGWLDLRWSTKPVRLDIYLPDDTWGPFASGQGWQVQVEVQPAPAGLPLKPQSDWLTLPG